MTDSEREVGLAPTAINGMDVAAADTAALNLDFDVELAEGLGIKLVLVECQVRGWRLDLETLVLIMFGLHSFRYRERTVKGEYDSEARGLTT